MDRSWPCGKIGFCGDRTAVSAPRIGPCPSPDPHGNTFNTEELTIPAVTPTGLGWVWFFGIGVLSFVTHGMIVKAFCVLKPGHEADAAMTKALQEYVKATIAPYKYPRAIEYVTALPRTQTGKLQRFELRRIASDATSQKMAS